MGGALSKQKRPPAVSTKDRAVLELKVQRDKLKQYEKKLQTVLDRELQVAREQLRLKNHHAARLALAKKKYQEQLLRQVGDQLLNLEQLTSSIEYAMVEQQVLEGLKAGNQVLQELNKEMRIEDVEKLMDDTADAIAYQNELAELISGKMTEEDEAEIMAQLDELVEQENAEVIKVLPSVPKGDKVDQHVEDAETAPAAEAAPAKAKAKQAQKKLEEPLAA
ncbi:Vacuolar protein sorting-associated protein 20 [Polyrhizophydium stewartii]|uniref:Vacuolar protein sorting-associated protein 20 n=1 Tax=Polyrhizophydium stewartii TaxID=2732419 RepID=A0ABR4NKA4_9FUNG|nr:Vacuolar protein sorting-associated protein 20 [Polyrhizophydium stewartii]